ncbi:MAG: hypothetical protein HYR66_01965, partial [Sphingobacteriales bacterium]|nr:hypothetical protein [Sphingobacteriales bacterium]
SHGFNLTLAEISNERLKKIKAAVKITCQRPQEDIFLVIDIFSPGLNKSISYSSGQSLAAGLKNNNSWANCTNELSIPADASGKDIVKVYAWNPKHQLFFMDDLEVSFEK